LDDVRPVLWEEAVAHDPTAGTRTWSGLTDNYLRVHATVPEHMDLHNAIVPTRLTELIQGERLRGEPDLERASWPRRPIETTSQAIIPLTLAHTPSGA